MVRFDKYNNLISLFTFYENKEVWTINNAIAYICFVITPINYFIAIKSFCHFKKFTLLLIV